MTFEQVMIVFFIVVIASLIFTFFWLWQSRLKRIKKIDSSFDEISARIVKELAEWQHKVAGSKHMLTGESWRDSAGKEGFVAVVYDDNIPGYLWYALGAKKLSDENINALCKLFWDENPRFGDLELHISNHPGIGVALRIRNPKRFATEVIINEKVCPLYQTGHSMFGASESGCISFISLYNKKVVT